LKQIGEAEHLLGIEPSISQSTIYHLSSGYVAMLKMIMLMMMMMMIDDDDDDDDDGNDDDDHDNNDNIHNDDNYKIFRYFIIFSLVFQQHCEGPAPHPVQVSLHLQPARSVPYLQRLVPVHA
jgi:hypothetical protein